jgi:DNA-binding CsgD family transcriptional regulator
MRVAEFIEQTNSATSVGEAFSCFGDVCSDYGFDRIVYGRVAGHPDERTAVPPNLVSNYPDDWMRYYFEHGFFDIDPVSHYAMVVGRPFLWSELAKAMRLTNVQEKCLYGGSEAGLRDGTGIPIYGPYGEVTVIGLASSAGGTEACGRLNALSLLAHQFHTVCMALHQSDRPAAPEVHLTSREQEVLTWCARGKSSWAIGEILSISDHAVKFHMTNAMRKLDTNSRISAVLKAIRLRLIFP